MTLGSSDTFTENSDDYESFDGDDSASSVTLGSGDTATDSSDNNVPTDTSESTNNNRYIFSLGSAGSLSPNNRSVSFSSSSEDEDTKSTITKEEIKAWWMQEDWNRLSSQ